MNLAAQDLKTVIERAIAEPDVWSAPVSCELAEAVGDVLSGLDAGQLRVAEPTKSGAWQVNEWVKAAVLLAFRTEEEQLQEPGPAWDKFPQKFRGWGAEDFRRAGFRAAVGSLVRRGAYIAPGVILMPSFVNLGAYVGGGTMVDTWASIGSCAQIGRNCHISAGAGIGGVLEPLQARPTVIEDDCFIGARSEVAEGVIVRRGSVLAMGVFITASTPIVDRRTGGSWTGEVPPFSVVLPGTRPNAVDPSLPATYCAVIAKQVDARTRAKTSITELLRQ
ncbi:MAG: 2,3,4,5-tetrahydropyridine-2,6-dicarboxylate N-succinyltransferase [Phenylobacterium sp.]|uniref:2,3,4,5-tetrahydropyridine-2,6-dicarboxylate N-succinyltransferase n=1 Tax=Phenylobacterium sp. TaxID=1871053 RepID=UPI00391DEE96